MTPTRISLSPRLMVRSSFCAACASSVTLLRVNSSVFSGVPGAAPAGQHLQAHLRARAAANELHDVVDAPAEHVGDRAFLALADAGDAVLDGQRAGDGGRAAFDDVHDGHVVVDQLQRRADAVVVEAHLDAVFLGAARREVARVRIVGARVGIHERLEHVVGAHLVDALQRGLVTLLEQLRGFVPVLAGEQQRQRVVLDALAPELVELGGARRPGRLLAIEFEGFVQRPVRLLVELRDRVLDALAIALLEAREDGEGRIDVAAADHVVEAQLVLLEIGDVGGEQAGVLAVDAFEVTRVDDGRELVVELGLAVVHAFEHGARPRAPRSGGARSEPRSPRAAACSRAPARSR